MPGSRGVWKQVHAVIAVRSQSLHREYLRWYPDIDTRVMRDILIMRHYFIYLG